MRKEEVQAENQEHTEQQKEEKETIMPRKSIRVPKKFPSGEKISLRLQNQLKKELRKIRKRG